MTESPSINERQLRSAAVSAIGTVRYSLWGSRFGACIVQEFFSAKFHWNCENYSIVFETLKGGVSKAAKPRICGLFRSFVGAVCVPMCMHVKGDAMGDT